MSEARPVGWTVETDRQWTVPPMQWTTLPLGIAPDCDQDPDDRVRLRVHGDGTDEQVTLRVSDGAVHAATRHVQLCSGPAPSALTVEEDVETRRRDGALEIRLTLRLHGPPDASRTLNDTQITFDGGLRAEVVESPQTVRSSGGVTYLPDRAVAALARFTAEECAG